ncbi:MAG: SRPBCC family protein [Acidimicrobiales bacterium]|nr:SRPBCC family protein [Acidimicrobiales bacterium]
MVHPSRSHPAQVWELFSDIPTVAQCMPGAAITGEDGPDRYTGQLKVKLGPMGASFEGTAEVTERDDTAMSATVNAKGVDKKGGSRASALVNYRVTGQVHDSLVEIDADISLQGALAQFGRSGIINDVSARLTREFATCLENKLLAGTADEAAAVSAPQVSVVAIVLDTLRSVARRVVAWFTTTGRRAIHRVTAKLRERKRR